MALVIKTIQRDRKTLLPCISYSITYKTLFRRCSRAALLAHSQSLDIPILTFRMRKEMPNQAGLLSVLLFLHPVAQWCVDDSRECFSKKEWEFQLA